MAHDTLENLKSDEFVIKYSFVSNYKAIHRSLENCEEVCELYLALEDGEVTEQSLKEFCSDLLESLKQGIRFPHEIAIAAIVIVMDLWDATSAKEFITSFGESDRPEMPIATRIAREVLETRENIKRMTPSNKELLELARRNPPSQE